MNDMLPSARRPPADSAAIRRDILARLARDLGKSSADATPREWFQAAALALRDHVAARWLAPQRENVGRDRKHVYYFSLEFLIGRLFTDSASNIGLFEAFAQALAELGLDPAGLRELEPDAALGNGGLGRLAACFMESMASLSIPALGYGIRYDCGLFRQIIADGCQQEAPDPWLAFGNPWEFKRPELVFAVSFGGRVEIIAEGGHERRLWKPAESVEAVAFDTPITGWRGRHVNALRLWSARSPEPIRLDLFNRGDYAGAAARQAQAAAISKFLYPNDETPAGRELRLRQEYFFVSASLQDIVARHLAAGHALDALPDHAAIQLNDTHPSLAIAELMRLLVDEHRLPWLEAWRIATATLSYTNHTLLPEALETWPVALFEQLLPRHLEIAYQINLQHLERAAMLRPGDDALLASVSLIGEKPERRVRMGHLAFIGCHAVNGVSTMHTDLMKETVFRDLHALYPGRISNKTNGITFRRWLMQANPALTALAREACGDAVLDDPERLRRLERHADDAEFLRRLGAAKRRNKAALGRLIAERTGVAVDPDALFDVHIKRIHEYKRQLLNIVATIALYQAIRAAPDRPWTPRVKIFAGKAAASYHFAKLIIKLINDVGCVINRDPRIRGLLKVVFLPDYSVSLAERIIPAADLSEQISTAGMEASGTGNMKLALNGALTVGTLDGANIEIRDQVGADNIYIFGLRADEVAARRDAGLDAGAIIDASPPLARVIHALKHGAFSPDQPDRFEAIAHALRYLDHYMVSADFDAYYATQRRIDADWQTPRQWARMSLFNTARMAWFSADRTIRDYAAEIWQVPVADSGKP